MNSADNHEMHTAEESENSQEDEIDNEMKQISEG